MPTLAFGREIPELSVQSEALLRLTGAVQVRT
jgi:hypothetical protein